ncbi:GNAT family N-acetyltransferase [Vallitalea pronyensis]|uniref:GNAT family N-acetyltransferase n=1 Tax=Vallitalea pronyensis TaxID=1348613 RepID=A0A8J8MID2_9FIRM|nr:GNAT family N-acetyltransferase [Vallitalea pronyensis]QUI22382.1 GNAT family N-acetyltransferase [Vallitalea pronyensis]
MNITLQARQLEHVMQFFQESKDEVLKGLFPFMENTLEEAIDMFKETLEPDATSYGKIICVDDNYIGDVWCYCIDEVEDKHCFLSIVIFDKHYWHKGIGGKVLEEFCGEIAEKYAIHKICAFTYKHNVASKRLLEKVGFTCKEEFIDDGIPSYYLEKDLVI